MPPTFADATYFIALMDDEDQWHPKALALFDLAERRAPLHLHALSLGEVVAVVGSHLGGKAARDAYAALRDTTEVHLPSIDDLDRAMAHVLRYDGTLSLSDALYLHFMEKTGAQDILSFDKDFDGKGVTRVHEPPSPGKRSRKDKR